MKELSSELKEVLARFKYENKFFDIFLNDPDRILRFYELKCDDVTYLRSLQSKEDLEKEFAIIQPKRSWLTNRIDKISPFYYGWFGISGLILLIAITYGLLGVYNPTVLDFLDVPLWTSFDPVVKTAVLAYGSLFILMFVYSLIRILAGLETQTRVILLIAVTVLIFIPGLIGFSYLSFDAQNTLGKGLLVLVFTLLPASMYGLFINTKGKTLWQEFEGNLARLDPVRHSSQISIYRDKFDAIYGATDEAGLNPKLLRGEATFPILLNTFITGLGWIFFFSAVDSLYDVTASTFTFGFLGAYFFSLQMLFRRYLQADLKSSAYTQASQRIVAIWVLSFVLRIAFTDLTAGPLLAFVLGIFPDTALQMLGQRLSPFSLGFLKERNLKQGYPLHKIEGITVWVESRLLEENIENVQNLVTTNIFDLLLSTNLPPQRIIHWIDQGVLQLHLAHFVTSNGDDLSSPYEKREMELALNECGIITATDLLATYETFKKSRENARNNNIEVEFFVGKEIDPKLDILAQTIDNDPSMYYVKAWFNMNAELMEKLPEAVKAEVTKASTVSGASEMSPQTKQSTISHHLTSTSPTPIVDFSSGDKLLHPSQSSESNSESGPKTLEPAGNNTTDIERSLATKLNKSSTSISNSSYLRPQTIFSVVVMVCIAALLRTFRAHISWRR